MFSILDVETTHKASPIHSGALSDTGVETPTLQSGPSGRPQSQSSPSGRTQTQFDFWEQTKGGGEFSG